MACKRYTPTGVESKLYNDLVTKYGETIANDTWAYTRTKQFKDLNLPVNKEVENSLKQLEDNNLIIDINVLRQAKESKKNFEFKAKELIAAFKNINIEVRENLELGSNSVLKNENGKPVIEYNPEKIRKDSVYHEFGHLLIDLVGYETPQIQTAVQEIRGTQFYNTIQILNPSMGQEQLDKEALTTRIGIEASIKDSSKLKFLVNTIIRKIKELLGISETAVNKLINQLVSKKVTSVLQGKLSLYDQHQQDIRIINNVFVGKKEVLENAIIKIEQKLRDYFSSLEPEQRYGNPIYRDFTNISNMLKEQKDNDINKGIIEFLTFAYTQTQYLETKIDSVINPNKLSERPEIDATFLRDLLNYNEAFGDIMEDLESVINSNYLLKQELKDYKPRFDESILNYIPKIKERYHKVKREGKKLSLEYVADLMLKTGDNNKFVEHLRNSLKRQWVELGDNRDLILKDRKEALKLQNEWANDEIEKLKNWKNEGERDQLSNVARQYYLNLLQQTTNDISWFERWLLAGNMINDEIIQYGNELLDKADYATRIEVTEEFRNSFSLYDRYTAAHSSSNQATKYEPLIEKDIELDDVGNLSFTGKRRQNLVSKYYSKFFEYKSAKLKELAEVKTEFGEESQEYESKWGEYQKFLDANTIRPYSEEYYRNLDSLPELAKNATKPLKAKKRSILQRYSVTAKNNVFNLTDITEDDADTLKQIEKQLKELSSKYTKSGNLKTGNPLKIAEQLTEYNKLMNEMYDDGEFQATAFGVARGRAKKAGKEQEFLDKNVYVGIKKEFWEDLEAAFMKDASNESIRTEIQSILKNVKGSDGTILVDELDENAVKVLRDLYNTLSGGLLLSKKWFKDNVKIEVRPEYTKKLEDMREMRDNGEITQEQYDSWYQNNHRKDTRGRYRPLPFWTNLTPKTKKYQETKYNKYWYTTKVKPEYENQNLQPGEEVGGLKSKWLNPQYTSLSGVDKEMYDYLVNRIEEDDKPLYFDYRLTTTDDAGNKYYKLPAVIKHTDTEIVSDEGLIGLLKNKYNRAKAALQGKKEDSDDFGGDILEALYTESNNVLLVQADEQGRERHRVPVNLRTPIDSNSQSYDLMSIILLNFHMSKNFQNKQELAHKLELMGDVLSERNVVETENTMLKGSKVKVNKLLGAVGLGLLPVNKKGESSNSYLAFKSMLESRLYGIRNKGSVTAHQITSLLTRYTGATALALNVFSAGANLVSGKLQNYIIASGSQFIGFKDIMFAKLELNKQAANLIADVSKSTPQSKIGKLIERINPKSDWSPLSKKFSMDSSLKRIYESINLDVLNSTGEVVIQSTLMLSVLNSAKALSVNGKYLNSELNETTDKSEAISIYDSYVNLDSGMVGLDKKVGGFEIGEKRIIQDADNNLEFYLSFFIRELNKSLQGDYDEQSISEARRNVIGKLALVLRRWYPATLVRRTRGMGGALKNSVEVDADEAYYNRATRSEEEGYYTTFVRYMYQIYKEGKRLKFEQGRTTGAAILESISKNKSRLLTHERANIHQMFGDMAATGLYLALSTILYTLGRKIDDENKIAKNSTYMLAFWILRAQRELTAYANPNEILRIANTPSVVLKQIKEITDVFFALGAEIGHQFNDPFTLRRYERTRRKGQSKTWKEVSDVAPIIKQFDKVIEEQLSYMTNVKGF